MENKEKSPKIEVVSGDGTDLDISPVSTHLPICKPKSEKKEKIVIPKGNKKAEK